MEPKVGIVSHWLDLETILAEIFEDSREFVHSASDVFNMLC